MIDVKRLIPHLVKMQLTADEFLILHLKYLNEKGLMRLYKNTFRREEKGVLTNVQRQRVIELGYMKKDDSVEHDAYFLTPKFLNFYVDEYTCGNELWDLYPAFVKIDGKNAPLMKADKAGLRGQYFNIIGGLKSEHEEVILDTKFGIDNNMISIKIVDYVRSEFWSKIRPIRLGDKTATSHTPVTNARDIHEF